MGCFFFLNGRYLQQDDPVCVRVRGEEEEGDEGVKLRRKGGGGRKSRQRLNVSERIIHYPQI